MKVRFVALVALLAVLAMPALEAVGTATWTAERALDRPSGIYALTVAWTSTAGGAVSANTKALTPAEILQVIFIPGAGGTQPSDLYDVTLNDVNGIDVLAGGGANLSNATAKAVGGLHFFTDTSGTLDLVVSNAGSAKTGTAIVIFKRAPRA